MERALNPLEFELDDAPAIEQLLTTIEPRWIMLADLFHDTVEDKVGVAQALYDEGLLAVYSGSANDTDALGN
jgi:lysine-specific demethylase/histidyl-hydroxylase NO66